MLEAQVKDQQARIFQLEHAQHLINGAASTLTGLTPTTSTSTNSAPSVINGTNNLPRTNPAFPCTTAAPSSQLFSAPPPSLTTNWQPQTSPMLSQPHFASPSANSLHASDHTSPQTVTGRSEDSRAVLDALPPPLVQSLLNVYEQYLAPSLPLFPPHSPHQWPWTLPVYAMVAAALRLPQGGLLLSNAESVRYAARNHVITSATESTSVESVQALTILVLETISSGAEPCKPPSFDECV